MNVKIIISILILSLSSLLSATIWEINQDGTGDFINIQEGIDAAADTDTVLVYPGTYYENINYNGKNITVASLYLTTQQEQYIHQTIIDGNQSGSCVEISSGEDENAVLDGFTITNGTGTTYGSSKKGGGINIFHSSLSMKNCIIKENTAQSGGGIMVWHGNISLSNTKITNNHACSGGGITSHNSTIEFDQMNLCDIYLNYAGSGSEIAKTSFSPPMEVYVDTFTVMEPDEYFIKSTTTTGQPLNDVTLYAQNAKLEPVNADLYIATDGDNANSGLSPDEPLATINYALSLVKSDSLHPNTIYLADGIYSKSLSYNLFPLNMRGYVSLVGESMENTILDAEIKSHLIQNIHSSGLNFTLKNLKLVNGNNTILSSGISMSSLPQHNKFVNFENIIISNCLNGINLRIFNLNINMSNIFFVDNFATFLYSVNTYSTERKINMENIYINNNHQYDPYNPNSSGGARILINGLGYKPLHVNIINMEISDNTQTYSDWPNIIGAIAISDSVTLNLVNSTIANNSVPGNGGIFGVWPAGRGAVANIYNTILYGNTPREIYIANEFPDYPATLNVSHSLVEGSYAGILNVYPFNTVNWLSGNLYEDPQFVGSGDYPYMLTAGSNAINAGTLDLPPGITLPETDLAGNPRIYGDSIDMGAYEWQGVNAEDETVTIAKETRITNYPNPFNPDTTIRLELAEAGRIELSIYNIKGQKVRNLLDAHTEPGVFTCNWNGRDDNGRPVASGQYLIKLKQNDEVTVEKMMLLK